MTAKIGAGLFGLLLLLTSALAGQPQAIDVKITTHLGDRQSFVEGDKISFFLSLEQDAYVYLFYRDASATLLQLVPNQYLLDNLYRQGMFMPLPSAEQPFQFTIQPPYGDEFVYAFATDNGDLLFPGEVLESGLTILEIGIDQVEIKIRQASAERFGQARLALTTKPAEAAN